MDVGRGEGRRSKGSSGGGAGSVGGPGFIRPPPPNSLYKKKSGVKSRRIPCSLRMPWVPAPGKTTPTTQNGGSSPPPPPPDILSSTSVSASSSIIIRDEEGEGSKGRQGSSPLYQTKLKKVVRSRGGMKKEYRLKSKDSLVDVTRFLELQREEILKLWGSNLSNVDESVLAEFERANVLALEATAEVDHLRSSIQQLCQNKESGLTEADLDTLDLLRVRTLAKVKQFEQVNANVHKLINYSNSNNPLIQTDSNIEKGGSVVGASTSVSTAGRLESGGGGWAEIIYKRDEQEGLAFGVQSDLNLALQQQTETDLHQEGMIHHRAYRLYSNTNATGSKSASTVPSTTLDLNNLVKLYSQTFEYPPIQKQSSTIRSLPSCSNERYVRFQDAKVKRPSKKGQERSVGGKQEVIRDNSLSSSSSSRSDTSSTPTINDYYYYYEDVKLAGDMDESNNKILYDKRLQRVQSKLTKTEVEVKGLQGDIQRIQSDSTFQVGLLRSNVGDRLERLEALPEYLNMLERKVGEVSQERVNLEKELGGKEDEVRGWKVTVDLLTSQLSTCTRRLEEMEGRNNHLMIKLTQAEQHQQGLSISRNNPTEENKDKSLEEDEQRLCKDPCQRGRRNKGGGGGGDFKGTPHHPPTTTSLDQFRIKNKKLEDKCRDLTDRLVKSKKTLHILNISKKKIVKRGSEREEALLAELEAARSRSRHLQSQIHYIRTTYQQLFPTHHQLLLSTTTTPTTNSVNNPTTTTT